MEKPILLLYRISVQCFGHYNSDFTGISQFLQFVNAQQSQTILVPITDDNVTEGVEELTVSLSLQDMELATSVNVTPAVATVRILDNDSKSLAYLPRPIQFCAYWVKI